MYSGWIRILQACNSFGRYRGASFPFLHPPFFSFFRQVAADSDADEDDVFDMDDSDEDSDDASRPAKGKGKGNKGKAAAGKVLTKRGSAAGGAKGKGKAATTPAKSKVRPEQGLNASLLC